MTPNLKSALSPAQTAVAGGCQVAAAAARSGCITADGMPAAVPSSSISGRLEDWVPERGVPAPGVDPGKLEVDLLRLLARGRISDACENTPQRAAGKLQQPGILSMDNRAESQRQEAPWFCTTINSWHGLQQSTVHLAWPAELHVVHPNRLQLT